MRELINIMILHLCMQVRSPADILPSIVADLANITNMNSAAVLYDDTFSKLSSERMISSNLISDLF